MADANSEPLDTVVGCIADLTFDQIATWLNSLDACGFAGRRVIIHVAADAPTVAELRARGCETYDASPLHRAGGRLRDNPIPAEVSVNRFYYIWYFLSRAAVATSSRFLLSMDVRDVLFQRNPSHWLERNLGRKKLVAGSESLCFEDEPWNAETMQACYGPDVWEAFRHRLIYNAGSIAGDFRTMVDLCLQVYLLAPGDRVQYSDQAALNVLLGSDLYAGATYFASSEDGWACQAGATADRILLEKVRHHVRSPLPMFDGEFVRTAAGEVFTVVHQYDRVPAWDIPLRRKYATRNSTPGVAGP